MHYYFIYNIYIYKLLISTFYIIDKALCSTLLCNNNVGLVLNFIM